MQWGIGRGGYEEAIFDKEGIPLWVTEEESEIISW